MPRSRGFRRKSRQLLRKPPRERGLQPLGRLLYQYQVGEKVVIRINSGVHRGMPHSRYYGKVGTVESKRGRAYVVRLEEGNEVKTLIIRPEHIKQYTG